MIDWKTTNTLPESYEDGEQILVNVKKYAEVLTFWSAVDSFLSSDKLTDYNNDSIQRVFTHWARFEYPDDI